MINLLGLLFYHLLWIKPLDFFVLDFNCDKVSSGELIQLGAGSSALNSTIYQCSAQLTFFLQTKTVDSL